MSEEQIAEALGAVEDEQLDTVIEETNEEQEELDLTPSEQKAWNDGWRPQDEFEGKPGNWKTAGEYNLYGEMQTQVRAAKAETRQIQADTDDRIANLNKLHDASQKSAIADLKAKQRQAVEEADTTAYDQLQTQIDNHQTVEQTPAPKPKDPVIAAWEAKNTWIETPNHPKTIDANNFWATAASRPGATAESALKEVDEKLAKLYPSEPATNPRRDMPTQAEQSSRPRSRQRGKDATMDSLSNAEQKDWESFGKLMFTEKEFLKSVTDARKS